MTDQDNDGTPGGYVPATTVREPTELEILEGLEATIRLKRSLTIWAQGPTMRGVRAFLDQESFQTVQAEEQRSGMLGHIDSQRIEERTYNEPETRWQGIVVIVWEDKH